MDAALQETIHHDRPPPQRLARSLRIRCPLCHEPLDVATDQSLDDVRCSACQGRFSLAGDDPEATAAAFEGEWYKTGDMLRRDAQGFYFFSDRKKDAVRYKGRNISTFEVELAARRHPAVADCAAFGVTSEELDAEQELMLDVVPRPGHALQPIELARFINDHAPYFFVPRYIQIVDSLPYTPTNKVQKYRLRERGVAFEEYDLPDLKTENGIASIGDLRASWARDPDGNIIAFEQRT